MALIVQNDAGTVVDANAYIQIAFADSYFADRGNIVWGNLTSVQKEQAIIKATDYIDNRFVYAGKLLNSNQTTSFPRGDLIDRSGYKVVGIPLKVKKASAEYAIRASTAELAQDPIYNPGGIIIGEAIKVDVISRDFKYTSSGGKVIYKAYPLADMLLRDFIVSGGAVGRG